MKIEYIGYEKKFNSYYVRSFNNINFGIYPVMFGNRIRVWKENENFCERDYCLGLNLLWHNICYNVICHCLVNGDNLPKEPDVKPNFNDRTWKGNMIQLFNKIHKNDFIEITTTDIEIIRKNEEIRIQKFFESI